MKGRASGTLVVMGGDPEIFEVAPKLFRRRKVVDKKGNTKGFVLIARDAAGRKYDVQTFQTRSELERVRRVLTEVFLSYAPQRIDE